MQQIGVASKVFRTGKQTLLRDAMGRWFVRLQNRRNDTTIQIPAENAPLWKERLS